MFLKKREDKKSFNMTAINDLSVGGENLYNFSLSITILKNVGFFMHLSKGWGLQM